MKILQAAAYISAGTVDKKIYIHGLQTPNEGINQRNLKNWADVTDKVCFGRT